MCWGVVSDPSNGVLQDKKKELQANLEYDEMKARRRSIGNIRWVICELHVWDVAVMLA